MTEKEKKTKLKELGLRKSLHRNYDILLALYINDTGKLPSKTNALELAEYSFNKLQELEKECTKIGTK